jgi:hypothetical protein
MMGRIHKAIRFPEAIKRKVSAKIVRPFISGSFADQSHIDVEWDNLIILDACRYDVFETHNPFNVSVQRVESNASHTAEFLERNFDTNRHDTVYISASPQLVGYEPRFHDIIHVWESDWDENLRTVRPESVTKAALSAASNHPNKKVVVHYMQPHYPFIGPTGRGLRTHATFTGGFQERQHLSIWELLSAGKASVDEVKTAYEENLEIALKEVVKLVDELDGKTVVTSDHGNLFGEQVSPLPIRLYGHPSNMPADNLIQVPLIELPFDSRRDTVSSPPQEAASEIGDAKSRLEDLGYL